MEKAVSEEVEEMVLEIIGDHFGLPSPSLSMETQIMEDCGADSFDQMELLMTLEELFGIKISCEVSKIHNIRDIVNAILQVSLTVSDVNNARQSWRIATRRNF